MGNTLLLLEIFSFTFKLISAGTLPICEVFVSNNPISFRFYRVVGLDLKVLECLILFSLSVSDLWAYDVPTALLQTRKNFYEVWTPFFFLVFLMFLFFSSEYSRLISCQHLEWVVRNRNNRILSLETCVSMVYTFITESVMALFVRKKSRSRDIRYKFLA